MKNKLQDHVVIVTGGTAGIGKSIALAFGQRGCKVAIFGTNQERGSQVVKEIGEDRAKFFKVDVANMEEVESAIAEVQKLLGPVDVLVNNAGITKDQLLMKMTKEEWDSVMNVNISSCFYTCKALVRQFLKARKGSIINISSVVALMGNPGQTNYAASKAAMIGFSKALAKELASRNIRVNCIAPGYIATPMTDALTEEQKKATFDSIPMGKMGNPEDIAEAAIFLAESSYITGQVLTVDGGLAM